MTPAMNLEIYEKDPRTHTLLNQGVAKVTSGASSAELGGNPADDAPLIRPTPLERLKR